MRLVDDFKSKATPQSGLQPAYKSAAELFAVSERKRRVCKKLG